MRTRRWTAPRCLSCSTPRSLGGTRLWASRSCADQVVTQEVDARQVRRAVLVRVVHGCSSRVDSSSARARARRPRDTRARAASSQGRHLRTIGSRHDSCPQACVREVAWSCRCGTGRVLVEPSWDWRSSRAHAVLMSGSSFSGPAGRLSQLPPLSRSRWPPPLRHRQQARRHRRGDRWTGAKTSPSTTRRWRG